MTPKLWHVGVTQVQSLPLLWDARKAGCGPEGSQEVSLLILENSLVTTQAVVARTQGVSERLWTGGGTPLGALRVSMACEALICVTSVIKFSGCQSHLIAVHNSGHPDGFY